MHKRPILVLSLILLVLGCPIDRVLGDDDVQSNVSYGSVTGLGFTPADQKLVYSDHESGLQYGLLWIPESLKAQEKAPLVILIHGGCWLNAYDIKHSFALASALAQAGYAVWSLEYRRTGDPGGGWPGSFDDIQQGIAYTSKLESYPVDLRRKTIIGHSAGGHLALLAGSTLNEAQAVIGLAAITDIIEYSRGKNNCQAATSDFMGGKYEEIPGAYDAANPAGHPLHKNTILLHGTADGIVPPEQARLPGVKTRLLEDAGHFDWIHPGTKAYRLLLTTLEDVFQK